MSKNNVKDENVNRNIEEPKILEKFIPLRKTSLFEGLVYGIVYEPMVNDAHGDWTSHEEIQKMAHAFLPSALRNGTWANKNHSEELHDVEIVESYIAPCDFHLNGESIKKGSWILVSKVNSPELKKAIECGEVTGYSLEGVGKKLDVALPKESTQ
jgi:hypothetical protein